MDTFPTEQSALCNKSNSTKDNLLSSDASTIIGSVILSLTFLAGIPGNAFVVWTILFRMRRRTVTCILILNLAVADGVTLLTTPFWIHFLVKEQWVFGSALCKTFHYVCCLNMYASVFIIAFMSVDRFVAVARPFTASRLRRKAVALKVLVALWAFAALMALPAPYYRDVRWGKIWCKLICEPIHKTKGDTIFHYTAETVVGFLVPYAIIVVSYVFVSRKMQSLRFRKRSKTERLIVAIVVAFGLFWLPYHVVNLVQVGAKVAGQDGLRNLMKEQRPIVTALAFISSSVNPVLYAFSGIELIRSSGPNFMAKLFEVTTVEGSISQPKSRAGRNESACLDQLTGL
ncbi:leukotriene B4 receptor 1-like isoform X2 [Heterodontus francisci]|uniref:leukotriene B4 receptor 1-like isoform X2 n=1 Tax=Heterodontus francisci TaxID=7792 RepID=UPI00355BCD02